MESLKGRFIIAYRPRYFGESKEHYRGTSNKIRMFVVLRETQDNRVLGTCINFFNSNTMIYKDLLNSSDYKCLKYDSYSNGEFYLFKKSDIICVLDDVLLEEDYMKIFNYVKFLDISSYDGVLKDLITNSIGDYYKNRIKVGSVVTIKESMDKFRTFYVVNLHDDCFEGIELKYERDFGLFIEGVTKCLIPYGSVYDTIVYSKDFSEKVNNMINEARLLLK